MWYTYNLKQRVGIGWIFTKQIIAINMQRFTTYEMALDHQMYRWTVTLVSDMIANQPLLSSNLRLLMIQNVKL